MVTVGKAADKIIGTSFFGGGDNLFFSGVGVAVTDIFHQRAVKQADVLRDDGNVFVQRILGDAANVKTVDRNAAAVDVVIAADQFNEGRFARTGKSDQSHFFLRGDFKREVFKQRIAGIVAESDIFKTDAGFADF